GNESVHGGQRGHGQAVERLRQCGAAAFFIADLLEQQQGQPREEERFSLGAGLADGAGAFGIHAIARVVLEGSHERSVSTRKEARASARRNAPLGTRRQRAAMWPSGRSRYTAPCCAPSAANTEASALRDGSSQTLTASGPACASAISAASESSTLSMLST